LNSSNSLLIESISLLSCLKHYIKSSYSDIDNFVISILDIIVEYKFLSYSDKVSIKLLSEIKINSRSPNDSDNPDTFDINSNCCFYDSSYALAYCIA